MLPNVPMTLTPRQIEVLVGMFEGKTYRQIGKGLGITAGTAKNHVQAILRKLQAPNSMMAVRRGLELGILKVSSMPVRMEQTMPLHQEEDPVVWLRWRDLELCPETEMLRIGGKIIELHRKQYRLLQLLLIHPLIIHTYDFIISQLWDGAEVETSVLKTVVGGIRKALQPYGYQDMIESVPNEGYRLAKGYTDGRRS